jgi:predicted acetyltransferase
MSVDETVVTLDAVPREQAPVLASLFELYAHDFSEHVPLEIKPSGRFDIPIADAWWTDAGHSPFFVRSDGKLGGFALVRRGSRVSGATDVMDVAEFFVVRGLRRKGIGERAAHALFERFPGKWEMRVRRTNVAASQFWSRVVESWSGRPAERAAYTADGVEWDVLRVDTSGRSVPLIA